MRALKLASLVTCSLALSVTTVAAAPQVLDDAALDGVVAGVALSGDWSQTNSGIGIRPSIVQSLFPSIFPTQEPETGVVILSRPGDTTVSEVPGVGTTSVTQTDGELEKNPYKFLPSLPTAFLLR